MAPYADPDEARAAAERLAEERARAAAEKLAEGRADG